MTLVLLEKRLRLTSPVFQRVAIAQTLVLNIKLVRHRVSLRLQYLCRLSQPAPYTMGARLALVHRMRLTDDMLWACTSLRHKHVLFFSRLLTEGHGLLDSKGKASVVCVPAGGSRLYVRGSEL